MRNKESFFAKLNRDNAPPFSSWCRLTADYQLIQMSIQAPRLQEIKADFTVYLAEEGPFTHKIGINVYLKETFAKTCVGVCMYNRR